MNARRYWDIGGGWCLRVKEGYGLGYGKQSKMGGRLLVIVQLFRNSRGRYFGRVGGVIIHQRESLFQVVPYSNYQRLPR